MRFRITWSWLASTSNVLIELRSSGITWRRFHVPHAYWKKFTHGAAVRSIADNKLAAETNFMRRLNQWKVRNATFAYSTLFWHPNLPLFLVNSDYKWLYHDRMRSKRLQTPKKSPWIRRNRLRVILARLYAITRWLQLFDTTINDLRVKLGTYERVRSDRVLS